MVARDFDTDSTYGAVVSELELFSLPPPEGSVASLRAWRDKVQLPTSERPAEKLMAKWLFERLKKVPALRRHTDRVRDAAEGTPERSFEWLWSRLDRTMFENQQEQNLQSIQEELKKGPKREQAGGAAAPTEEQKQKEAEAAKVKAAAAKTAPSKADAKGGKGNKDNKGKGKGQGKDDGKKGGGKSSDPNVKKALSEGLCLFFQNPRKERVRETTVPSNTSSLFQPTQPQTRVRRPRHQRQRLRHRPRQRWHWSWRQWPQEQRPFHKDPPALWMSSRTPVRENTWVRRRLSVNRGFPTVCLMRFAARHHRAWPLT